RQLAVLSGGGKASFPASNSFPGPMSAAFPGQPQPVLWFTAADFNNDGRPDVAAALHPTMSGIAVYINALAPVPKPTIDALSIAPVNEGDTAMLFRTVGGRDPMDFTIDWGDGTFAQTFHLVPGNFAINHTYVDDNPSGTPKDNYTIHTLAS